MEDVFWIHADGEKVTRLDIQLGANHRGIEKLAESKSWFQLLVLLERICGICSSSHPAACVRAIEESAGIAAPERAQYIRTFVCELERIQSHMLWFGLMGRLMGHQSLWMWTWKYREDICILFERITGNRQNYAMFKPGGVRRDIDAEMIPWIFERLDRFKPALDLLKGVVDEDPIVRTRLEGVGILSREEARSYGVVGPVARASGLAMDVRKDDPYFAYHWVDWNLALGQAGDILSKARVRLQEMVESIGIAEQCIQKMKAGPIEVEIRGIPPGMGIGRIEAPRGELFHCMVSDGTALPVRYQIRPPTYVNVVSSKPACLNADLDDAALILAAADPCLACVERMVVIERGQSRNPIISEMDLVRRSQEKSARIRGRRFV